MAKCEEGYLCAICEEDVERIVDSELYLRYVIGLVDPETLHTQPERHIRCLPSIAQFIVHEDFDTPQVEGDFDKRLMSSDESVRLEKLYTAGWTRLRELEGSETPLLEYPLPEVRDSMRQRFGDAPREG